MLTLQRNTTLAPTFRCSSPESLSKMHSNHFMSEERSGIPLWSLSIASKCTVLPSSISKHSILNFLHSSRLEQIMTVALSSTLATSGSHWEHRMLSTSLSYSPSLTFSSRDCNCGSLACLISWSKKILNVLKMSRCDTASSCAGSPSRMTCLPPQGCFELPFFA